MTTIMSIAIDRALEAIFYIFYQLCSNGLLGYLQMWHGGGTNLLLKRVAQLSDFSDFTLKVAW